MSVELVPAPLVRTQLPLGRLIGPGRIVLYVEARVRASADERARLLAAAAHSDKDGVVIWPGDSLRRFMLGYDVLTHELGHHVLQHERRLRGARGARTSEHESYADAIAAKLRALLD